MPDVDTTVKSKEAIGSWSLPATNDQDTEGGNTAKIGAAVGDEDGVGRDDVPGGMLLPGLWEGVATADGVGEAETGTRGALVGPGLGSTTTTSPPGPFVALPGDASATSKGTCSSLT